MAFAAVFICVLYFWNKLKEIFTETGLLEGLTLKEMIFYAMLILLTCVLVTSVFVRSDAFYGTDATYNVIYTSDSHYLVYNNAWLNL